MRYSFIICVFCLALMLIASLLSADVPGKLSYQGYLTDSGGDPLDTNMQMIFTIYNNIGGSKWSEEHTVSVSGGVFGVELGSITPIPDTVFNGEERYLGIKVGDDPEISPRTLLTSSPQTFISQRVNGDIETGEGSMVIKDDVGDSTIVFDAGVGKGMAQIYMMEPGDDHKIKLNLQHSSDGSFFSMFGTNPDGDPSLLELSGNHNSNLAKISMFYVQPPDEKEILTMTTSPTTGASIKMATPVPEPPPRIMEMSVKETDTPDEWGSFLSMYSVQPPDKEILEISGTPSNGASIKMFNPQPEPPRVYLEMLTNATDGASINFYDDAGQVMGFDPSPFNSGFSIKMFNPQPEPLAVLLDINSTYGTKGGTSEVALYDDSEDLESHLTPGKLSLNSTPGPAVGPPIVLEVNGVDAKVGIGNDSPSEPLAVGDDLTYFSGNLITVGDANPTSYAGISFGQDADNRGWMIYDNEGDYIYFGTKEDGVFAPNAIYMKGGDLGIGTDSPDADLHVVGDICYTGSIGTCSDARYKKDVSTLSSALDKVTSLRGVSFNWRRDEFPENDFSDKGQVGLIAQEVENVFPEIVSRTNDGYYNVDYTKLTPLLVEAIKELKTQNEELKSVNKELIRRIERLEGEEK